MTGVSSDRVPTRSGPASSGSTGSGSTGSGSTGSGSTGRGSAGRGLNLAGQADGGPASTALLTDRYELTMVEAALRSDRADVPCIFEVFARRLPSGRRYGVTCGIGRLLEAVEQFRFGPNELAALEQVVDEPTLAWLADFRFTGDIAGYPEGEVFFPGSPILTVESSFAQGVVLETLVLSILNHDCAIAAAASRMVIAAHGRPCLEMGSRRTHEHAAVAAARAAYIAGFEATSNLQAGADYGIPTMGTAAHAFTLLYEHEREAFAAQIAGLGSATTLLVDTYDVRTGVATAVEVAGTGLGAVRLDSGDLLEQAFQVRAQLDSLGAAQTRIVVTSDLDEYAIAALAAAPVDSYGVGTSLVTGSGAPTAGLVYKLVARGGEDADLVSVAKRSLDKTSVGGRKWGARRRSHGVAVAEVIGYGLAPSVLDRPTGFVDEEADRVLTVPLMRGGVPVAIGQDRLTALVAARERHTASLAELPATARQLSRGEPVIATVHQVPIEHDLQGRE